MDELLLHKADGHPNNAGPEKFLMDYQNYSKVEATNLFV